MFTLSIILNLHREEKIAEKTILNIKNILNEPHDWKEVEVIAILDNTNKYTQSIVQKHAELFSKIEEVYYKDLGDSRNHGVALSKNEFIVFADGDDYCSHNMLQSLYKKFFEHYSKFDTWTNLTDKEHIAIFPKYLIEFPNLFQMNYCDSNNFIVENNRFLHCYHSKIATKKELLIKNRIRTNKEPYGYEDWDLNNRLLAQGVQYKTASYILYYRRNPNQLSMLSSQVDNKHIVRNSKLYAYENIQNTHNSNTSIYMTNDDFFLEEPKSHLVKKHYRDILFKEHRIFLENYDEQCQPKEEITQSSTLYYANELSEQSKLYNKLLAFLLHKDIIYIVPWINLGGADKVILEYTKALPTQMKAGVITTLNPGTRISHLTIEHFDMPSSSTYWHNISTEDKLHIITKAIINSNIKFIHVINSELALQTIKYYNHIYNEYNIKIAVSLFCPDYDWENRTYHGFPIMYPELFNNSHVIFSDNNYWYNFFKGLHNGKDFNYKKLFSPTDPIEISYHFKQKDTKKILWASRICNQKLFSIFEEIVNHLPNYHFIIYSGKPQEPNNIEILQRLLQKSNVEFRGEYQHINELNLNEYDLYLFTSLYEGIPTIILDMAMGGIPIVTANVGGISEVLGKDYPLFVNNPQNAQAYIDKIKLFYHNKETIIPIMKNIREFILSHHNVERFQKEYLNTIKRLLDDYW